MKKEEFVCIFLIIMATGKVKLNVVVEIFEVLNTIPDLLYLNSNVLLVLGLPGARD